MNITRLFDLPYYQLVNTPKADAFVTNYNGEWKKTSTQEYINLSNQFSRGLLKLGIKPQDKISIVTSRNRTEWNIADIGIQQVGAVSVPLYPTLSDNDYAYIINNSESKFCIVSDKELYDRVLSVKDKCPTLVAIYTFDEIEGAPNISEILSLGEDDATQSEVDEIKNIIKTDDIVTLIYTSGTTGAPKGVMLSHENIVSNTLESFKRVPNFEKDSIALSFLPINHVFERMLIYLYMYSGISIYYAESIEKLGDNLKEIRPHVITVVPRLVEKVFAKIYDTGASAGGIKTKLFLWALNLVEDYVPYKNDKGFWWNIQYKIAYALVFKKWREGVGGRLVTMVSGSAALSVRLNRLFWAAGIPVLEGYGLTETSPVISVNSMSKEGFGLGTVGKPLENADVKFAEDGEILVKGTSVFKGYYKEPEKTAEAFTEDGYFKTGDIGTFENGLLKITDRKKEMFKTSGGKYIAPQVIENLFKQSNYIEQVFVVGDGEKMPCAIIQPDFVKVKEWAKNNNLGELSNSQIATNPEVKKLIEGEVNQLNNQLGHWEQIKKIELTPTEWSVEGGELTPTLKLKRKVVKEKYQDLYDKLYEKVYK